WDGILNDIRGQHVRPGHVEAAYANARGGPIAEGNVGGGTGMQCYGFKGGSGTSSRLVRLRRRHQYTVGVFVQANHGERRHFQVNGVPVGAIIDRNRVPFPRLPEIAPGRQLPGGTGSVIVVAATDAPLLPHQLDRLAQRAGLGVTKFGAYGQNYSGDLMVAFSTAARLPDMGAGERTQTELPVTMLSLTCIDAVFEAVIEATAEAILNAMLQAETMTGRDGVTLYRLDGEGLANLLHDYHHRSVSLAGRRSGLVDHQAPR
ncbi:MAG TPA: P1 family peptidase, partial [Nakamurella sp.]